MRHNSGSIKFTLERWNIGKELLDILEGKGVDPEAVIVGHTDVNPDLENLVTLVERGLGSSLTPSASSTTYLTRRGPTSWRS